FAKSLSRCRAEAAISREKGVDSKLQVFPPLRGSEFGSAGGSGRRVLSERGRAQTDQGQDQIDCSHKEFFRNVQHSKPGMRERCCGWALLNGMARPLRCAASPGLAAAGRFPFLRCSWGRRPPKFTRLSGKSRTCRASEWQSQQNRPLVSAR